MYICIYTYMYLHVYAYCVYIYIHIYTYMYNHIYIYIYIYSNMISQIKSIIYPVRYCISIMYIIYYIYILYVRCTCSRSTVRLKVHRAIAAHSTNRGSAHRCVMVWSLWFQRSITKPHMTIGKSYVNKMCGI